MIDRIGKLRVRTDRLNDYMGTPSAWWVVQIGYAFDGTDLIEERIGTSGQGHIHQLVKYHLRLVRAALYDRDIDGIKDMLHHG